MFGRLLMQTKFRFVPRALPHVPIGRMSANTTDETIQQELKTQLEENGIDKVKQTIEEEQIVLQQLQANREKYLERVKNECVAPAVERFSSGYNIGGLFWSTKQEQLNQIISKEQFYIDEEMIDWLSTRQKAFKGLSNFFHDSPTTPGLK